MVPLTGLSFTRLVLTLLSFPFHKVIISTIEGQIAVRWRMRKELTFPTGIKKLRKDRVLPPTLNLQQLGTATVSGRCLKTFCINRLQIDLCPILSEKDCLNGQLSNMEMFLKNTQKGRDIPFVNGDKSVTSAGTDVSMPTAPTGK